MRCLAAPLMGVALMLALTGAASGHGASGHGASGHGAAGHGAAKSDKLKLHVPASGTGFFDATATGRVSGAGWLTVLYAENPCAKNAEAEIKRTNIEGTPNAVVHGSFSKTYSFAANYIGTSYVCGYLTKKGSDKKLLAKDFKSIAIS